MKAKKILVWALTGACGLALAGTAWADDVGGDDVVITPAATPPPPPPEPESTHDFTRDGWYLSSWATYAFEEFQRGFKGKDDWGFGVNAGYRGGRNFAGELEFEMIPNQRASADPYSINVRHYHVALNFKAYPLARVFDPGSFWNRFQPFAQAGFGWGWADERWQGLPDDNDGAFTAPLGGGIDWYITDNLVLTTNAAYILYTNKIEQWRHVAARVGLQWRFGAIGD